MHPRSASPGPSRIQDQVARSIVLAVLFATPALLCLSAGGMSDPDIWWHLRTGEWIAQHHAVPHADMFSAFAMGKPWVAYSWLFELLVYGFFKQWGLAGIVLYTAASVAAITAAFYGLIAPLQADFSKAALLTIVGVVCLSGNLTPRPWMLTIVFFLIEFGILMRARREGNARILLWLPPLFVLWANIHIQFLDGLLLLGVAAVEPIAERWWPFPATRMKPGAAWGVLGLCLLGTLVNPYGWRVYQAALGVFSQNGGIDVIADLGPMRFRDLADFVLLFLALAAAAALVWSRRPPFFETALMVVAAYLSFHSMRDRWFMAVVACAILAPAMQTGAELAQAPRRLPAVAVPGILLAVLGLLWAGAIVFKVNETRLQAGLAGEYPVEAVEAVQRQGLNGPVFNDFDWGGYLIWSLPELPVSIDGRTALYGNDRVARNVATWNGKPDWAADPDLASARVVIGHTQLPLTQLLRQHADFKLVYEDKLAAVFVRSGPPISAAGLAAK